MKLSPLWLPDAVSFDLTTSIYLYDLRNLSPKLSKTDILNEIKENLDTITSYRFNELDYTVEISTILPQSIHAQIDLVSTQITLNNYWLKTYEIYTNKEVSYNLHLYHELFHLIENQLDWFSSYTHKDKYIILEVTAIMFSQIMVGIDYHPRTVEYQHAIENNTLKQNTLIETLERTYYEFFKRT